MSAPPIRAQNRPTIQVRVNFCVVEGAKLAQDKKRGAMAEARPFADWLWATTEPWQQRASILFVYAGATNVPGVPVIADPTPDGGNIGEGVEATQAADACLRRWSELGAPGAIAIVVAKTFYARGGNVSPGGATPVNGAFFYGQERSNDFCAEPRRLTAKDVPNWMIVTEPVAGLVYNPVNLPRCATIMLAHELGHALMLSHGDGIDQDPSGEPAGVTGPRLYDEYCDPDDSNRRDGIPSEDPPHRCSTATLMARTQSELITCSSTNTDPELASCDKTPPLTDLQVETARAAASAIADRVYPTGPTCNRCSGANAKDSMVTIMLCSLILLRRRSRSQ